MTAFVNILGAGADTTTNKLQKFCFVTGFPDCH